MIEFVVAYDIVEQADAMIDTIYFTLGTLVEMGVDPKEIFDAAHWSNMEKLWPDGKLRYDQNDKIMKPGTWESPKYKIGKNLTVHMKEQADDDIPY